MHSPVFLIGTQRSGTTLLCRMLTAHPDVFVKNELPVRSVFTKDATREDIERNISHFVKKQYGDDIAGLLQRERKKIWGLKDPELTHYLDPLKQFLPEARFIVITRDPRAVVNSYIENKWGLAPTPIQALTGGVRRLRSNSLSKPNYPTTCFAYATKISYSIQRKALRRFVIFWVLLSSKA